MDEHGFTSPSVENLNIVTFPTGTTSGQGEEAISADSHHSARPTAPNKPLTAAGVPASMHEHCLTSPSVKNMNVVMFPTGMTSGQGEEAISANSHHSARPTAPNEPSTAAGVPASMEHGFASPSVENLNVVMFPTVMTSGQGEEAISADSHHSARPKVPNKHELQVIPDEDSFFDDALLKSMPYIVNKKYMVLICTDCRYYIIPDRARVHLHKDHPHCKVDTTFVEQLKKKFPGLVAKTIHPPETIEAVFGLAIPFEKYTVCSRCRRGYLNISTWERHLCRNTDANLAGQHLYFHSLVQTFFRGPSTCYFPIDLVSDGTSGHDDFDLFKVNFQEVPISDDEIRESKDYRELDQFLLKEGWINHVSGLCSSELSLLTCLPKDDEILKPIAREIFVLMDSIQRAIGSAGYHVRRLLGRRPAYVFLITMFYHC